VLYFLPERRLYFLWAQDELRRVETEKPNWRGQGTISFRFCEELSKIQLPAIVSRILKEGQFARAIHDKLARTAVVERLAISIGVDNLSVIDGDNAYSMLRDGGCAIVASGYAAEAIRLAGLLNRQQAADPRINLICAYAEFSRGRMQASLAYIAEAVVGNSQLSKSDTDFLKSVKAAAEFRLGRMDSEQYLEQMRLLEDETDHGFSILLKIERLRLSYLAQPSGSDNDICLQCLRQLVDELTRSETASAGQKIAGQLAVLYVEGCHQAIMAMQASLYAHMARVTQSANQSAMHLELARINELWIAWAKSADAIVLEAVGSKYPNLVAEALLVRSTVLIMYLTSVQNVELLTAGVRTPTAPSEVARIESEIRRAKDLYAKADIREGAARADMTLADLFEISGQLGKAKDIARNTVVIAEVMGYTDLFERARALLNDATLVKQFNQKMLSPRDLDIESAEWSDDDLRRMAQTIVKYNGLPVDRTPIVERDCAACRDSARERVRWCKHFDILQDLTHTFHPSTKYKEDPFRVCVCTRFNLKSLITAQDWTNLIPTFKASYCNGCSSRSPKLES
jgi:hypothetical protein